MFTVRLKKNVDWWDDLMTRRRRRLRCSRLTCISCIWWRSPAGSSPRSRCTLESGGTALYQTGASPGAPRACHWEGCSLSSPPTQLRWSANTPSSAGWGWRGPIEPSEMEGGVRGMAAMSVRGAQQPGPRVISWLLHWLDRGTCITSPLRFTWGRVQSHTWGYESNAHGRLGKAESDSRGKRERRSLPASAVSQRMTLWNVFNINTLSSSSHTASRGAVIQLLIRERCQGTPSKRDSDLFVIWIIYQRIITHCFTNVALRNARCGQRFLQYSIVQYAFTENLNFFEMTGI